MNRIKERLNLNLDLKSITIGFLLALCLMLVAGFDMTEETDVDTVGQYQCSASGDGVSVFVIDTETGQTWRLSRTDNMDFGTPYERKSLRKSILPMID